MLSGRARALVLLGWSFAKVLLRPVRRRQGIRRFHRNFAPEGLAALEPGDRRLLRHLSRCVACGRCELDEAERLASARGAYPGPMQLVMASTRSLPDLDAAELGWAHLSRSVLRDKQECCPADVPFAAVAEFVTAKAGGKARRLVTAGGS